MQLPDPKLRIEAAFVDLMKTSDLLDTKVIVQASDREVAVGPTYIMCWAQEVTPRSADMFVVKMQVVLVTNIDDTTNADRMAEAGRMFEHLAIGRSFQSGGARILGWSRPVPREASDGQETGDSLIFMAGIQINTDNPEMSTQIRNIEVTVGETLDFTIDTPANEAGAIDVAGWSALLKVRASIAADPVLSITSSVVEGELKLVASTAGVLPAVYLYDVRLESPKGVVSYPYRGAVSVIAPISTL